MPEKNLFHSVTFWMFPFACPPISLCAFMLLFCFVPLSLCTFVTFIFLYASVLCASISLRLRAFVPLCLCASVPFSICSRSLTSLRSTSFCPFKNLSYGGFVLDAPGQQGKLAFLQHLEARIKIGKKVPASQFIFDDEEGFVHAAPVFYGI